MLQQTQPPKVYRLCWRLWFEIHRQGQMADVIFSATMLTA
jgi:hypothetical protein